MVAVSINNVGHHYVYGEPYETDLRPIVLPKEKNVCTTQPEHALIEDFPVLYAPQVEQIILICIVA